MTSIGQLFDFRQRVGGEQHRCPVAIDQLRL